MLFSDYTLHGNVTPSSRKWDSAVLPSTTIESCSSMLADLHGGTRSVPCPLYNPPAYFVSLGLPDTDPTDAAMRTRDEARFFFVRREVDSTPFRISVVLGHGVLKYSPALPYDDSWAVGRIVEFARRFAGLPDDRSARDSVAAILQSARPLVATAYRPQGNSAVDIVDGNDNADKDFWASFAAEMLNRQKAPMVSSSTTGAILSDQIRTY